MLSMEKDVVPTSDYYIHTPSTQAQEQFLYPLITGFSRCLPGCRIARSPLDCYLILYVRRGKCELAAGDGVYGVTDGQVVFLDCHSPYQYQALSELDIEWLCFSGVSASGYYSEIAGDLGPVITLSDADGFANHLHQIYLTFQNHLPVKEILLNGWILNLLTELLTKRVSDRPLCASSDIIADTIAYIEEHLTEPLSLEALASRVSLSPFYFSRLFKRKTGYTPHSYILSSRVRAAQYLLRTTDAPVRTICARSGFTAESAFCTLFKKMTGFKPSEYREIHARMAQDKKSPEI